MCKKAFSILLALALLLSVPAFQTFAAEDMDLYDLQAKVIDLEKQLNKFGELVKDLSYNVQENQALSEIVKELSFQLKKSESDIHSITSLQDRIERDVIPQMISIQSTVASLGASLNEKVKALGIRVYETESSIQQVSARIRANEDRLRSLDGIEDAVRDINERLYATEKALEMGAPGPIDADSAATVAAAVAELEGKINKLSMQVSVLKGGKEQIDTLTVQLSDIQAAVGGISDRVDGVAFSVDGLRTRMASAEAAQASFATWDELGQVQSQVDTLTSELKKARGAASTNFLIGMLGVLAGVGALALTLL